MNRCRKSIKDYGEIAREIDPQITLDGQTFRHVPLRELLTATLICIYIYFTFFSPQLLALLHKGLGQ